MEENEVNTVQGKRKRRLGCATTEKIAVLLRILRLGLVGTVYSNIKWLELRVDMENLTGSFDCRAK